MELKHYFRVVRKRLLLISAIVLVVCTLTGVRSFVYTDSIYQANAKLIVNQAINVNGVQRLDWSSIQTNITLINSYKEIIHSSAILNKVVRQYPELNTTPGQLNGAIFVSAANDSQVMNITAVDKSYKRAVEIANAVSNVFKQEIPSIMHVDNVTILSEADATIGGAPINSSPTLLLIISFIVALMIGIGLAFLLDYLDDTVKTEEDVAQTLDLPMLSYISKINKSEMKVRRSRGIQQKAGESTYAAAKQ